MEAGGRLRVFEPGKISSTPDEITQMTPFFGGAGLYKDRPRHKRTIFA
jgi:hypothetical protein